MLHIMLQKGEDGGGVKQIEKSCYVIYGCSLGYGTNEIKGLNFIRTTIKSSMDRRNPATDRSLAI